MKKYLTTLSVAAAVIAAQAMPARAINKEWSAVAGFVGGVLVANAAHGHRSYHRDVYYHRPVQHVVYQPVQHVVYQPVQHVVYQPVVYHEPQPRGYYEWRTERVWNPGCWVYESYGYNSRRKVWQPGYYQTVRNKVWVSAGYSSRPGW